MLALNLLNADRTQDHRLAPYMKSLRKEIQAHWAWSAQLMPQVYSSVYFEVSSTGTMEAVSISKGSGVASFDDAAISAIKNTGVFVDPPQAGSLKIVATFNGTAMFKQKTALAAPTPPLPPRAQPASAPPPPSPSPPVQAPQLPQGNYNPYLGSWQQPAIPMQPSPMLNPPSSPAFPLFKPQTSPSPRNPALGLSPEWLASGNNGTHHISKVTDDGHFVILDDGSVWKSEDEYKTSDWTDGNEVVVIHGSKLINVDEDGECVDADCEERACTIIAETRVSGEFQGSEKPVVLTNGMIFELSPYHYTYKYSPEAVVLVTKFRRVLLYKVIIDDEIYDATRLR